jgi:hypothetical protein
MFSTPHVNMCWHDTLCVEHVTWQINLSIPYFFLCMDVLMSRLTSSSNKLVQRNFYSVLIKTYGFFPKKKQRENPSRGVIFFVLFIFFCFFIIMSPPDQRNMVRFISRWSDIMHDGYWFISLRFKEIWSDLFLLVLLVYDFYGTEQIKIFCFIRFSLSSRFFLK